jgi:hypothetical protein
MTTRKRPPAVPFGEPTTQTAPSMPGSTPVGSPTTQRGAAPLSGPVTPGTGARGNGAGHRPAHQGGIPYTNRRTGRFKWQGEHG